MNHFISSRPVFYLHQHGYVTQFGKSLFKMVRFSKLEVQIIQVEVSALEKHQLLLVAQQLRVHIKLPILCSRGRLSTSLYFPFSSSPKTICLPEIRRKISGNDSSYFSKRRRLKNVYLRESTATCKAKKKISRPRGLRVSD